VENAQSLIDATLIPSNIKPGTIWAAKPIIRGMVVVVTRENNTNTFKVFCDDLDQ
jgi:hypothetical protein